MAGARPGAPGPFLQINGLDAFRRGLRAMGAELAREVTKALKAGVERTVVPEARRRAEAKGSVHRKAAPAIRAASTASSAKLAIGGLQRFPFAEGAFFGAKKYRQFPPWVGNQAEDAWPVGVMAEGPGQGPYAINPAIAATAEPLEEAVWEAIEDLAGRTAYPFPF